MRAVSALFGVLLSSVLAGGVAIAASSMAGETFTGTWLFNPSLVVPVTADCVGLVSGTVQYISAEASRSTAIATGPYPGFYTESGTVTVANNVITGWSASWGVSSTPSGEPYVTGTKALSVAGPGTLTFICMVDSFAAGTFDATLRYTANGAPASPPLGVAPFTGSDTGLATASLQFNTSSLGNPPRPGTATGTFSETFLGSQVPPPAPAGCNTEGDSHGNDECAQEGNN